MPAGSSSEGRSEVTAIIIPKSVETIARMISPSSTPNTRSLRIRRRATIGSSRSMETVAPSSGSASGSGGGAALARRALRARRCSSGEGSASMAWCA